MKDIKLQQSDVYYKRNLYFHPGRMYGYQRYLQHSTQPPLNRRKITLKQYLASSALPEYPTTYAPLSFLAFIRFAPSRYTADTLAVGSLATLSALDSS